jgi:hypothetical protein
VSGQMIDERYMKDNMISKEFDSEKRNFWFDMKQKKFLHNIDTLYYTVKLANDFTKDTDDTNVLSFINEFEKKKKTKYYTDNISVSIPKINIINYLPNMSFGFYNVWFEVPEQFDIIFATYVPCSQSGISHTPEITVQIRSYPLWIYGPVIAYEQSINIVKAMCQYYGFEILEVKENRFDFCWHTNYIQNPEQYFNPWNLSKMIVSQFKRGELSWAYKPKDEIEPDYLRHGKRGGKVFNRIYLKTKEVIERGYKPWFLKLWQLNGLISRYDLFVLEEAFQHHSWNNVNISRLKFYVENGSDKSLIEQCRQLLDNEKTIAPDTLQDLADMLTPRITIITNIEYQVMRKATKSYPIIQIADNSKYGIEKRMYDFFDNRTLITRYLTHDILRLVETGNKVKDTNKSRREYNAFWSSLRSTKQVDCKFSRKDISFIRTYNKQLNGDIMKKKLLHSVIVYGIYNKGINEDDVLSDCAEALLRLNDNDIDDMKRYKKKKSRQFNVNELAGLNKTDAKQFYVVDEDGQIIS